MVFIREDFDNEGVANANNPSGYGYHHGKHLQNIHIAHANINQGPIPNPNPGWKPERELSRTHISRMLNLCTGQRSAITSGQRRMYSIIETGCRSYANHM